MLGGNLYRGPGYNCGFCERPGGVSPIYQNVSHQHNFCTTRMRMIMVVTIGTKKKMNLWWKRQRRYIYMGVAVHLLDTFLQNLDSDFHSIDIKWSFYICSLYSNAKWSSDRWINLCWPKYQTVEVLIIIGFFVFTDWLFMFGCNGESWGGDHHFEEVCRVVVLRA